MWGQPSSAVRPGKARQPLSKRMKRPNVRKQLHSSDAGPRRNGLIEGALLFSEGTMNELRSVLFRSKFDHYVSREERATFLAQLSAAAEFVEIIQLVRERRDPKDDKFPKVALSGKADVVITNDADLLALHQWREIEILSPAECLKH
jgi:uncharacterized protein